MCDGILSVGNDKYNGLSAGNGRKPGNAGRRNGKEKKMEEKEEIRIKKELGELKAQLKESEDEKKRMAAAYASQAEEYKKAIVKLSEEVTGLKGQVKAYRKVLRV